MSTVPVEVPNEPRRFTPWLAFAAVLGLAAFAGTFWVYFGMFDHMVDQVPVHWDWAGRADRLVPKGESLPYLLIGPISMDLMVILTLLLPWMSPRRFDVDRFRGVFQYVMALSVIMLGYIQLMMLLAALGQPVPMPGSLIAGIMLFFAVMANSLGKVRRNFWIGVRTPWTLASERVWNATHRLSAWLYLAAGIVGFVAVLAGVNLTLIFICFMAAVLWPAVYSLILYKRLERTGELTEM
jgi:uncharacterized membrane protein